MIILFQTQRYDIYRVIVSYMYLNKREKKTTRKREEFSFNYCNCKQLNAYIYRYIVFHYD